MKFGVFNVMQQRHTDQSASQALHEAVDQAVTAEALGYDLCWFPGARAILFLASDEASFITGPHLRCC